MPSTPVTASHHPPHAATAAPAMRAGTTTALNRTSVALTILALVGLLLLALLR
jgi:hypothetical protein